MFRNVTAAREEFARRFFSNARAIDRVACASLLTCLFLFAGGAARAQATPDVAGAATRISAGDQTTREARVAGVVRDAAGAGVEGASVTLELSNGAEALSTKRATDAAGGFDFGRSQASVGVSWTLRVTADGFTPYEQRLDPERASVEQIEVVLAPATLAEAVTINATRVETRLGETPASVVVIDDEQLRSTAALALDDRLRQVPGFQLFRRQSSRFANPTAQGVSLRGTGASGASRALVVDDGVPLLDPFGGWVYWGRVPRTAIGSVEVLRGAASDLYGTGALGGVIAVSRRATPTPFAINLETSIGTLRTPEGSLWIGGRSGRWGASIAAEAFRTDGYIQVAEAERGSIDTPVASRRKSIEATLERFFDPNIVGVSRLYLRANSYGERRANGTPLQTNSTAIRLYSFGIDGGANARTTRAIGVFDAYTLRVYGGTQTYDQSFTSIAPARDSEVLTRLQLVPAQTFGFTSQASRVVGSRHTIFGGADAREVRGASDETVFVGGRAASLAGAGGRERTFGVFVGDSSRIGERLILGGALRFDRWRNYAATNVTRPLSASAPSAIRVFPERSETAFSPRASALFRLTDNFSLAASAARAFRQPTLNELYRGFRVGNVQTLANENLRAERAGVGEAGFIFTSTDRRLSARATAYLTEITRPVANVTLSATPALITRRRENLGRTRTRGFEFDSEARLTNRFTLSGGYLFADARTREFTPAPELVGLRLPQVARHQGSLQARYVDPNAWTLGVQARASGAQFDDDQNRFRLRPFFTLDAFAARRLAANVELFAAAENLTNSRYDVGRTPVLTVAPPTNFRLGVRVRYGVE